MTITARLTSESIRQMADELRNYETSLRDKITQFRERLAAKGIIAARASVNPGFGQYITFEKQDTGDTTIVLARETSQILSSWLRNGEQVDAWVSPLLMSEFGAGKYAVVWQDTQGGSTDVLSDGTHIGRGTFNYPEPSHGIKDAWYYMDLSGNWQTATGIKPSRPMHSAVIEIITQIESTAREVFGNG